MPTSPNSAVRDGTRVPDGWSPLTVPAAAMLLPVFRRQDLKIGTDSAKLGYLRRGGTAGKEEVGVRAIDNSSAIQAANPGM